MRYSFVIVNWNTKDFVLEAVDSILRYMPKDRFDYEIILVDNASSDDSVAAFRSIITASIGAVIEVGYNRGFAGGANIGARHAKGDYCVFFNSDAKFIDDSFLALDKYLCDFPEHLVGVRVVNMDSTLQDSAKGNFPTIKNAFQTFFLNGFKDGIYDDNDYAVSKSIDWVSGVFIAIKKDIFNKIGGFPERHFMYTEDMEMCFNAKENGYKVVYFPHTSLMHYRGGSMGKASASLFLAPLTSLVNFHKEKIAKTRSEALCFLSITYSGYVWRIIKRACINKEYRNKVKHKIKRAVLWQK